MWTLRHSWYDGISVVAVEPSEAMRVLDTYPTVADVEAAFYADWIAAPSLELENVRPYPVSSRTMRSATS